MKSLASVCGKSVDDLHSLSPEELFSGMSTLGIKNYWLHEEEGLFSPGVTPHEWPIADSPDLESILIGDCQYESRGFEAAIMSHGMDNLRDFFQSQYKNVGERIAELYEIDFSSATVARPNISAFINDIRFAFAADKVSRIEHSIRKRKCYRYLMDVSPRLDRNHVLNNPRNAIAWAELR